MYQKNTHKAFSLLEVLIATAILSIIGVTVATLLSDTNKSYKTSEIDQAVSLYTMNLRQALARGSDCTASLQPVGALGATTSIPTITNSVVPGLCGAVACTITAGTTSEPGQNRFRVNRMFLTGYTSPDAPGCDQARPTLQCKNVTLNIEFSKVNPGSSTGGNLLRTIPIVVRTSSPGNVVQYCYSILDKEINNSLYVQTTGDTMTGPLINTYASGGPAQPGINLTNSHMIANYYLENSDKNLKHDIHQITNSESILNQLNGVEFKWNMNDKKDWGFIAQDVEAVAPHLVSTDPATNLKSVKYSGVIPVLVEVAKKLEQENDLLEKKIQKINLKIQKIKMQKNIDNQEAGD